VGFLDQKIARKKLKRWYYYLDWARPDVQSCQFGIGWRYCAQMLSDLGSGDILGFMLNYPQWDNPGLY